VPSSSGGAGEYGLTTSRRRSSQAANSAQRTGGKIVIIEGPATVKMMIEHHLITPTATSRAPEFIQPDRPSSLRSEWEA
jgi:hypothetical protein